MLKDWYRDITARQHHTWKLPGNSSFGNHHPLGHVTATQVVWATVLYTLFIDIVYTCTHNK